MAETISSFPQSFGSRPVSALKHYGPASYTQIGIASPPTGGDQITAAAFGLKFINFADVDGMSDDGTYGVICSVSPDLTHITLYWYVLSTGAQVGAAVNLSARQVRVFAIGH